MLSNSIAPIVVLGRYSLFAEIAAGGMATVHFGRLAGPEGFSRTVAIKRLHPQYAKDPSFAQAFMDEARVAVRIRHPNIVPTLDVVQTESELFLVMEYVPGEALSKLLATGALKGERIPVNHTLSIMTNVLHGLHAAHEAKSDRGEPLSIVHRDVSPQNVLVGVDGVARVLDFGVAKAANRSTSTNDGTVKGKPAYMAREQITGESVDRRTDVYAASIVLWECLTGDRLFAGDHQAETLMKIVSGTVDPPSKRVPGIPPELDAIVLRGLAAKPEDRFQTAREMARALEKCGSAPASDIGEWVEKCAGETLAARADRLARIEGSTSAPELRIPTPAVPTDLVAPPPTSVRDSNMQVPPSSQSFSPTGVPSRMSTRMLLAIGVVLLLLVAAGGTGIALGLSDRNAGRTTTVGSSSSSASSVVAPSASTAMTASADPVPDQTPAPVEPSASPSTSPSTVKSATSRPLHPPVVGSPKPNCNPPYVVDADGNRKYKRECLRHRG